MQRLIAFWQTTTGKLAILGGGGLAALLSLCAVCAVCGMLFGGNNRPAASRATRAVVSFATETPTPFPTATTAATPTFTPLSLADAPETTPLPAVATPQSLPTDTPLPALPAAADTPTPLPSPTTASASSEAAPQPAANLQEAQVVEVVDGDTIKVVINGAEYTVRYILVDTPETKHPTKGVQPFGPEASAANTELVAGKTVRLEKDVSETDQYGRLLRYVYVGEMMVNEELLRRGLAQVATFPPDVKYVDRFLAVQREAQAAEVGLWGQPVAETPTPTAAPSASGGGSLVIVALNKQAEYVDIQNKNNGPIDLAGWHLLSEKGTQDCVLGGVIQPDETLRVWAMSKDAGQGGFNCGFGKNIWNNTERDPAVLFDPNGVEVSRKE